MASKKIIILHIIKSLGRGGAEMLLPETLKLHDQEKFEFHYIYFLPWKDQLAGAIRNSGGKVTCISSSNNFQIVLKSIAVIQYIKKHKIQLVHCHLPWAGMVGRIVNCFTRLPVLYTEHNKQERYHFLTRWMNRLTFNWQQRAIAVSADVRESIEKNIAPRIPIDEILNGVDTKYFSRINGEANDLRQQFNIPLNACVVGTVAVFRFQKRLKEWMDVFAAASLRNSKLFGVIVGDGPLLEEIKQHRKSLGLDGRVIMPGLLSDVRPWYAVMDIFMMTSVFEGLPIALLEAMSMECAVVTTNAGGIKEVVEPGKSGLVQSVNNWEQLTDDLLKLSTDENLRSQFSIAARSRVQSAFRVELMVKKLEHLYYQCADHRVG